MGHAAGLRRVSLSESQTKGEDALLGPSDSNDRKSFLQELHGNRFRRVITSQQCAIGTVAVIVISLLVGVSLVALGPVVSKACEYSYRTVSGHGTTWSTLQSPAQSNKLDGYEVHDASEDVKGSQNRIQGRKSKKNLVSSRNCVTGSGTTSTLRNFPSQSYHFPEIFYQDFMDMACQFKIFIYPHSKEDPFANIFRADKVPPTGNYASEHYFKMALVNSNMVTEDPAEADLFYLPFSIANMRHDSRIGAGGIKTFVKDYVSNLSVAYPHWNRSGGADHFYVNCHSIGKTATEEALHVRTNAIQVVCSSNYHISVFIPHKDATIPQVWPRTGLPERAHHIEQRETLAFFAGAGNSPVRALVAEHWSNDSEIKVYSHRIQTPYDEALLTSKFCLHVKGFEVNTARLADALYYGCVPIVIADYHDLPYNDVLDWSGFSLVVKTEDIPNLKKIIKSVSDEEYVEMQKHVMQVRQHFQWHQEPQHFDAFYMVMYELWLRRHVTRSTSFL